jgi:hypothetical protein
MLIPMVLAGCNHVEIPKEQYYQFYIDSKFYVKNDTLYIYLNNPVGCPLRYYVTSSDSTFDIKLSRFKPITLKAKSDTIVKIAGDTSALRTIAHYNAIGDLNKKVAINRVTLPFPKARNYKVIQGYNGTYSHNNDPFLRYSIDFDLNTYDTICAADDGIVVGVIDDYKYGGNDLRFKAHANLITLYHPHSGLFTQYVHLTNKGSFVMVDDSVSMGQPIGLAGETGFTDMEHLHFNVLAPADELYGLNSVKISFIEGYEGEKLRRGDRVKK